MQSEGEKTPGRAGNIPMATQAKQKNQHYSKAREEFDRLKIEEKAIFLVESAFSMLAQGIEAVGNLFSEQIDKVYKSAEGEAEPSSEPAKKRPARKSTASKSRKRPAARKSSTGKSSGDAGSTP